MCAKKFSEFRRTHILHIFNSDFCEFEGETAEGKRKRGMHQNEEGDAENSDDDEHALSPANGNGGEVNKKRKTDNNNTLSKALCSDLIVLGLPYKLTEEELQDYFKEFGNSVLCEVCFVTTRECFGQIAPHFLLSRRVSNTVWIFVLNIRCATF